MNQLIKNNLITKENGFTLLEVIIVALILALIAVGFTTSFVSSLNTTRLNTSTSQINMQGQTALNHIVNELRYAIFSSIIIDGTNNSISFRIPGNPNTFSISENSKTIVIQTNNTRNFIPNMVENFKIEQDATIPKKINIWLNLKDNTNPKSPTVTLFTSVYPLN